MNQCMRLIKDARAKYPIPNGRAMNSQVFSTSVAAKKQLSASTSNATIGIRGSGRGVDRLICLRKKPLSMLLANAEITKGIAMMKAIIWFWIDSDDSENTAYQESLRVQLLASEVEKTRP